MMDTFLDWETPPLAIVVDRTESTRSMLPLLLSPLRGASLLVRIRCITETVA